MKRFLTYLPFLLLTLLPAAYCSAARPPKKTIKVEKPDMELIKKEVLDPKSKYFYPRLMAQYEKNETIQTLEDYRHLYLGAIFQEDYNPYRHSPNDAILDSLYYKTKVHTRAELDSIIMFAHESLEDDPFDMSQMNFLIYALEKRGKKNIAKIWQYRLNKLLEAILSTGTGLDQENAWIVIDPKHEFNIINFQGDVAAQSDYIQPYYEYILLQPDAKAKPSDKRPEGYWFNIRYILEEYYRKFPEQDEAQ